MLRTQTTFLIASLAIAGCRSTKASAPVLQPATITTNNNTSNKPVGGWILAPSNQPHTYNSISQTTVHELSNSTVHQNTIEVSTTFTISLDQSHTPSIISGHVDAVKFHPENQLLLDNKVFGLPLVFEGKLTLAALTISVKNSQVTDATCNPSISSILSDLHAVIAIYPLRLTPGQTWTDSTLVTTCTPDGIPTRRKTIQHFSVVGERAFNTTTILLLQRLDSTSVSGNGTQGNHQIHLEGAGVGTANIYISPNVAVMLDVELFEKLEITVTNSRKTRRFIQEVTQRLQATN